ncbi:ribbon-helix-helix domain-containing protein [Metabacillus fastidiosus]|uniref:Ribbon-helix-helix domain-containing protein n=1 Tax=Metabacillus fastidiosus TaxID=1458 RepID=A0ABU6NVK4_9BACI|nr:ribbon-helix-helix domain-containing protein [Metabacillus fastidiosus]
MPGHYKQPNYKPTTSITIDEDLFKLIDKFKHKNEFDNRSQAIETLIRLGFKHLKQRKLVRG